MQVGTEPFNRKETCNPTEVPAIRNSTCHHKKRYYYLCGMLKSAFFLFCVAGFVYQSMEFLANFYAYPTVFNSAVEEMEQFPTPALTFCSKYLYDFRKYCRMYSYRCRSPENVETFCKDNPDRCEGNKTNVVTPTWYPMWMYGDDLIFKTSRRVFIKEGISFEEPFPYYNVLTESVEACYRLGTGLIETGLRTLTVEGSLTKLWFDMVISFEQRDNIYFKEKDLPLGTLFVHSPLLSFKRFTKSVTVNAGIDYQIYTRLEAEELLPSPYETHCENYIELWKENNFTGPVSREMCRYDCLHNTTDYFEKGHLEENTCYNVTREEEHVNGSRCGCFYKCKDDCLKLNYHFSAFHVRNPQDSRALNELHSRLELHIESNKVPFVYHRAQYMDVELFSYIGGFLGCWLGISLWTSSGLLWEGVTSLKDHYSPTSRRAKSP